MVKRGENEMTAKIEKFGEEKIFWFEAPRDDLEKEAREASERFERYLETLGK